jgi:hypothetical protein
MNKLQQDLETWIYNWVSVYNENLQAVPCPFAKQAYVDGKILVQEITPMGGYSMSELIYSYLDTITDPWPFVEKEVIVLGCDSAFITAAELADTVSDCNARLLESRGYVALEDHPSSLEIVAGEIMNQGSWALVLLQSKEKLNKASAMLERQGYYKTWNQENLDDVVNWRKNS